MRSLFSASGSGGRVRILTVAVFLTHSPPGKGLYRDTLSFQVVLLAIFVPKL